LITASAPGKVILFGEHAVVSGIPAVGSAIDIRAKVSVENLPGRVVVEANGLMLKGFSLDMATGQIQSSEAYNAMRYVSAVLSEFQADGLRVRVDSDIPPAAGLGSSAAIVVATATAINRHFSLGLSLAEIASRAYKIEKGVQHGLGSPMDTSLATFGGYTLVHGTPQQIDLPRMELVVGYTEREHNTQYEVQKVQRLRSIYPEIVEPIFQAIGEISTRAIPLIRERRNDELGQLMNINHGLLEALGVGTRELNDLVYAARGAGGAAGAKLTGAGGGGCMIAIPSSSGSAPILTALKQARGRSYLVRTGCDGARVEA
jgi:mevalonate kinase